MKNNELQVLVDFFNTYERKCEEANAVYKYLEDIERYDRAEFYKQERNEWDIKKQTIERLLSEFYNFSVNKNRLTTTIRCGQLTGKYAHSVYEYRFMSIVNE